MYKNRILRIRVSTHTQDTKICLAVLITCERSLDIQGAVCWTTHLKARDCFNTRTSLECLYTPFNIVLQTSLHSCLRSRPRRWYAPAACVTAYVRSHGKWCARKGRNKKKCRTRENFNLSLAPSEKRNARNASYRVILSALCYVRARMMQSARKCKFYLARHNGEEKFE